MDELVAYRSRWRAALGLAGCLMFVAGGAWLVGLLGTPPVPSGAADAFKQAAAGWTCLILFGGIVLVYARRLFDSSEELRIGPSGIAYPRWNSATIPWSEIVDVTVWRFKRQKMIMLHLRDPAMFPGKGLVGKLQAANRAIAGGGIAISMGLTNRSFGEAMDAIERFWRR